MDIEETANAIAKYIQLFFKPSPIAKKGVDWMAKQIGKSDTFISEHLDFLKLNKAEQKVVKNSALGYAKYFKGLDEKTRKGFLKKISNEFLNRETGRIVGSALSNYSHLSDKILALNFKGMNAHHVRAYLAKTIPNYTTQPITDILKNKIDIVEELATQIMKLNNLLKIHSLAELPKSQRVRIASLLYLLNTTMKQFNDEKILITDI
jgi:hypothetical protein